MNKIIFVLACYYTGKLIGLYSTRNKAKKAAREYLKEVWHATGKEILAELHPHEVLYTFGEITINITRWQIDKALIKGEWQIL